MEKINGLDLFSGIGGIGLGLNSWVRTIAYCERDRYAQGVLLSRMQSGDIDRAPIFTDVCKLSGDRFITKPDIIFGGFPCQDISVAGNGKGLDGERSGLFYEIIRLTKEINPTFVFLENVPAIRTRGLREVLRAFAEIGYDCRWTCLSASSLGALHKRERWFLLAHAHSEQGRNKWKTEVQTDGQMDKSEAKPRYDGNKKSMADTNSIWKLSEQKAGQFSSDRISHRGENVPYGKSFGLEEKQNESRGSEPKQSEFASGCAWNESYWAAEPDVGRVVNGLPFRVDRIKCLGNSVVPYQVKTAFEKLLGKLQ